MARWTEWRPLAKGDIWTSESFDRNGPATYELGVGRSRRPRAVYVGETGNEAARMRRYGSDGSHLSSLIDEALDAGATLFYRAQAKPTRRAAKSTQDRLLCRKQYPWNQRGRTGCR